MKKIPMRIAYLYPEKLPSAKARGVSAVNTAAALGELAATALVFEASRAAPPLARYYGADLSKTELRPVSRSFLGLRSNRFFNHRIKRLIPEFEILYVRHLKTAKYLIDHKRPGQKVIFEAHEIFHEQNPKVEDLERDVYARSDGIVFINATLRSAAERTFSRLCPNRTVAYLGANTIGRPKPNNAFVNVRDVYYVGSLLRWKGVETAIEAISITKGLNLVVVGGQPSEIAPLRAMAHSLGAGARVGFRGQVTPRAASGIICNEATVVVLPNSRSAYDRFTSPLKLFEYMSGYNTIVASDIPTIRELTDDGACADLFKASDAPGLARTLDALVADPVRMRSLAETAFTRSKRFRWDARATELERFFMEVRE